MKKLTLRLTTIGRVRLNIYLALCITSFFNFPLWVEILSSESETHFKVIVFLIAIASLLLSMTLAVISIFSVFKMDRLCCSVLLLICGVVTYFGSIGVVIDESMIANALQTNFHEATELSSYALWSSLLLFSALPIAVYLQIPVSTERVHASFLKHLLASVVSFFLFAALLLSQYQYNAFFFREHRELRFLMNPHYAVGSLFNIINEYFSKDQLFTDLTNDALQTKPSPKRTVGILIVGETVRADHLSINGYPKETSPNLSKRFKDGELVNYGAIESCGTSTAYSVPCMFSFLDADSYSPKKAKRQSNTLDALQHAGVSILWRDNNSSCKGVCERVPSENLRDSKIQGNGRMSDGLYYDEVLLNNLEDKILNSNKDMLIVLHPLGSHGPAYHKRYPEEFSKYSPHCDSNSPQNCSVEAVINSYDNTVLYADHITESSISILEDLGSSTNTFLMYVSDHGESLGEDGIYLHGLPKSIAPREQLEVPMVLWLSSGMRDIAPDQAGNKCPSNLSHDNLSHTILSLFSVNTNVLLKNLNVFTRDCINIHAKPEFSEV